ncbi:rhamnulokinase [Parageobacillus thermoglucosidasius]|uniref:rhamnulokinase n=1 Tax=Parageobacillus thermoglucosidasius TaxID=1426 RepID=UPI00025B4338|nr:rhamnulokinase [Parageobacillus thermoglucosidasius]EID43016.1 rhamnulokinase [Parageobacillus thermoglucosidasius TNO-09.020]KYD16807.1 Rhamnulokinase [Anoxybacillus flavithermus]OAO87082.1 Rhamnulokinase [Parageobacillus thermoglucosidasius]
MIYVAVDIGASSGRLVLGEIKDNKLKIKEIHRFSNGFTVKDGTCYWDIDYLLNEILKGLQVVKSLGYDQCTVGIDTWAVDYVLLDQKGKRLREVVSYRDGRTKQTIEKVTKLVSKEKIYKKTGIQFLPFNTIYQLYEEDQEKLKNTNQILMVPDYLGYCLTGVAVTEVTNASTTQLLNLNSRTFDDELLDLISVKREQFARLVEPGTELGMLKKEWFSSFDLPNCKIITVATHDTASAVIGTPGFGENWAYLSSGTWSLLGIESAVPIVNELALQHNYTNEWGAFQTIRFLKNIIGMWIIQEVRRHLEQDYDFAQFVEEAKKVKGFHQFINFNDERFMNPANMIDEIQTYCKETNQKVPETVGELANCIYNNLAIIYAIAIEELEEITGKTIDQLHIVGGGAYNEHLNQLTADLSGKVVYAGPTEATAIGNLIMQMIATKEVKDLEAARQLIRDSFEIKKYTPNEINRQAIIQKFKEVVLYDHVRSTGSL